MKIFKLCPLIFYLGLDSWGAHGSSGIELLGKHFLLLNLGVHVSPVGIVHLFFQSSKILLELVKTDNHCLLFLILFVKSICVSLFLLVEVLEDLFVLPVSDRNTVSGFFTELLNKLESLDGLSFDLLVMVLHSLEVGNETVKLSIEKVLEKLNILSLVWILIKDIHNLRYL